MCCILSVKQLKYRHVGVALMFLRLASQYEAASLQDNKYFEDGFRQQIPQIVSNLLARTTRGAPIKIRQGHTSPLDSPIGSALLRVLIALQSPSDKGESESPVAEAQWKEDIDTIRRAIEVALSEEELGVDEVLYGRAGLLWAVLNLRTLVIEKANATSNSKRTELINILSAAQKLRKQRSPLSSGSEALDGLIAELVDTIVRAGMAGSELYQKWTGDVGSALPLMWPWHGKFYLGAYVPTASFMI